MAVRHPFDDAFRERLRKLQLNQAAMAQAIGKSTGWYNKFIHGSGKATIDDYIRIAAVLVGLNGSAVDGSERRLLRVWKRVPVEDQEAALSFLEKRYAGPRPRKVPPIESGEREAKTTHRGARTWHGTP